jgi:signal transduction histidine kinase
MRPLATAIQGSDGRLWFTGTDGVACVDTKRIKRNLLPPPVWIESISGDGRRRAPADQLQPPLRTRNLQIAYTALSLSVPERVRFRYRLEGVDTDWQDAGSRRVAFYTNLAPGYYRFRVIAANNDGVWNRTGDSLGFAIPPEFFQTNWFLAVGIAAGAGALWLLYLLRLRQLTARVHDRLEERLVERDRIARELHDTLLQGMRGFILRFHALSQRIPPTEPIQAAMKAALDRAQQVLVEARGRVTGLRGPQPGSEGLLEPLTAAGEELARDHSTVFQSTVQGQPRELHPVVREETQRIGIEALTNAFRHAGAGTEVELRVPAALAHRGRAKRRRWF